jgi:hypothetical protein
MGGCRHRARLLGWSGVGGRGHRARVFRAWLRGRRDGPCIVACARVGGVWLFGRSGVHGSRDRPWVFRAWVRRCGDRAGLAGDRRVHRGRRRGRLGRCDPGGLGGGACGGGRSHLGGRTQVERRVGLPGAVLRVRVGGERIGGRGPRAAVDVRRRGRRNRSRSGGRPQVAAWACVGRACDGGACVGAARIGGACVGGALAVGGVAVVGGGRWARGAVHAGVGR